MQDNMRLPANGGQSTSKRHKKTPKPQPKWTLLNLLTTYFLTDDGRAVVVDSTAGFGASHDEWRQLVMRTGVLITEEQLRAPWGQMARRDFLNWCEEHLPEARRPQLFASREAALHFVESNTASKSFEISESDTS